MERNEGLEEEFNRVMRNSSVVRLIHRQAESQGWSDVDALKACVVYLFSSNETLIQKCVDMSLKVPVEFFANRNYLDMAFPTEDTPCSDA